MILKLKFLKPEVEVGIGNEILVLVSINVACCIWCGHRGIDLRSQILYVLSDTESKQTRLIQTDTDTFTSQIDVSGLHTGSAAETSCLFILSRGSGRCLCCVV